MFEDYEDAKTAIIEALLRELEENEKVPEKMKKSFISLIKKIDFLKVGTKIASTTAPIIASLVTGNPLPVVLSLPNNTKEIEITENNQTRVGQ